MEAPLVLRLFLLYNNGMKGLISLMSGVKIIYGHVKREVSLNSSSTYNN